MTKRINWEKLTNKILEETKKVTATLSITPEKPTLSEKASKIEEFLKNNSLGCSNKNVTKLVSLIIGEEIPYTEKKKKKRKFPDFKVRLWTIVRDYNHRMGLLTPIEGNEGDSEVNSEVDIDISFSPSRIEDIEFSEINGLIKEESEIRAFIDIWKIQVEDLKENFDHFLFKSLESIGVAEEEKD
jgi:hypothetical protein